MQCTKCGSENHSGYKFCLKCGSPLVADPQKPVKTVSTPSSPRPAASPQAIARNAAKKSKDLLRNKIAPAEGEISIRTYYCTYYKSGLLGLEAWGYLGVTNKRVIFQALGTSNAGSSVIQSELPISEISGMSSYKGTFFSFGHMMGAVLAALIASGIYTSILALIIGITIENNGYGGDYDGLQVFLWLVGIAAFIGSLFFARHSIWRPLTAVISSASLTAAGGGSFLANVSLSMFSSGYQNDSASIALFFASLLGFYSLFCIFWYARRPTFSLAISSKGGSNTPISISGANGIGIFDASAGKALSAEPAEEAESMLQELGALILDIQTLGDLGISKWKNL